MASKTGQESEMTGEVIKISELPIYEKPEVKVKQIPEEIGQYRQGISTARTAVWDWMDSVEGTTSAIKHTYETGKAHTQSTVDRLSSDDNRGKVGVIGGVGLASMIAGYGSGPLRFVGLCVTTVTAATVLCYPHQAIAVTTKQYETIKDKIFKKSS